MLEKYKIHILYNLYYISKYTGKDLLTHRAKREDPHITEDDVFAFLLMTKVAGQNNWQFKF